MHQIILSIHGQKQWKQKAIYNQGIFNTRQEYLENVCSTSPLSIYLQFMQMCQIHC